jgi:hypothetical protein
LEYLSRRVVESHAAPGVRFAVRRMSLGRRIELTRRVHELSRKIEFLQAGGSEREQIEAAWLGSEIDGVYLRWGLESVEGLVIDGDAATAETVIERGPEGLCREILAAIRAEAFLNEDERKN